jgi:hydrogenase expression/formation protein HypC
MCVGIPLQVTALDSVDIAHCAPADSPGALREVNTGLLDTPPRVGDWLLVHMNVAIRTLSAGEAGQIGDALKAVTAAAAGEPFEHLIADLVDREPQLPEHLRARAKEEQGHG